jgi:hypothetical protein
VPIPNGSAKRDAFSAKCISLSSPWLTSIREPAPMRKTKAANDKELSEQRTVKSFFIVGWVFWGSNVTEKSLKA